MYGGLTAREVELGITGGVTRAAGKDTDQVLFFGMNRGKMEQQI